MISRGSSPRGRGRAVSHQGAGAAACREAGDPGIEPGVAVLETAVLPIHQSPWHAHSRPGEPWQPSPPSERRPAPRAAAAPPHRRIAARAVQPPRNRAQRRCRCCRVGRRRTRRGRGRNRRGRRDALGIGTPDAVVREAGAGRAHASSNRPPLTRVRLVHHSRSRCTSSVELRATTRPCVWLPLFSPPPRPPRSRRRPRTGRHRSPRRRHRPWMCPRLRPCHRPRSRRRR